MARVRLSEAQLLEAVRRGLSPLDPPPVDPFLLGDEYRLSAQDSESLYRRKWGDVHLHYSKLEKPWTECLPGSGHTCHGRGAFRPIGTLGEDMGGDVIYQCSVCYEVLTEAQLEEGA